MRRSLARTDIERDQNMIEHPVETLLKPYVGRLVTIDVAIGDEMLKLLFDTGGGKTFIVPDIVRRLGCTPSGHSVSFRMDGEIVESQYCYNITLSIDRISFHHDVIGVWDINRVLPSDLPQLDGILALNTFRNQPFTLDLASKKLVLESQGSLPNRTSGITKLESRIATGLDGSELDVFLHGKVKEFGWFLLDSGNLDATIVAPHLAIETKSDVTESSNTWEAEFAFGNSASVPARFRTRKIIYDGALSEEFLREWVFTFDLINNSVWVLQLETE
jgi:hypothetical protein